MALSFLCIIEPLLITRQFAGIMTAHWWNEGGFTEKAFLY